MAPGRCRPHTNRTFSSSKATAVCLSPGLLAAMSQKRHCLTVTPSASYSTPLLSSPPMMVRVLTRLWRGRWCRLGKAGEVEACGAEEPRKWCKKKSVRVALTANGDSVPCGGEGGSNRDETLIQERVKEIHDLLTLLAKATINLQKPGNSYQSLCKCLFRFNRPCRLSSSHHVLLPSFPGAHHHT